MNDALLATLYDEKRVRDVVLELFVATDERRWKDVEACLTDPTLLDMASAGGGPPTPLRPADIAGAWASGLAPIQRVHHQVGNLRITVEGAEARATCHGIAYHFRPVRSGRNTRTFVGTYEIHLRRSGDDWRIDAFRFDLGFLEGNADLHSEDPA